MSFIIGMQLADDSLDLTGQPTHLSIYKFWKSMHSLRSPTLQKYPY